MKRKEEFIQLLADQIRCKRAREDVIREMEAHISDQAEAYEAEGMEPGGSACGSGGADGRPRGGGRGA